jgi:hypothetical protein
MRSTRRSTRACGPSSSSTERAERPLNSSRAIFIVEVPLIWLDEHGNAGGYFDVHD